MDTLVGGEGKKILTSPGSKRQPDVGKGSRSLLGRAVREPAVHFLVLGVLLFAGYAAWNRGPAEVPPSRQIELTLDDLRQLQIGFASKWQRAPTQQEMMGLLESRIREEVLYREAIAMGLDKDDTIVKRRMVQKMEFLAEDVSAVREPKSDELKAWFEEDPGRFALPGFVTFRHLYFSPDRRGDRARDDAARALQKLAGKPESWPGASVLADPFMFQDHLADRDPSDLAKEFGPAFARSVFDLKPGSWQGPVESGYGWHLVFVDSLTSGRVPTFEEVEPDVKSAWLAARKAEAWDKAYKTMRAKYALVLPAPPENSAGAPAPLKETP